MSLDRFITIYIAQVLLALIVWFIFRYYYNIHQRKFLLWWSVSWLFYAVVYGASIGYMSAEGILGDFFSFISLLANYLQLLFLIIGVISIRDNSFFEIKKILLWCLGILLFSLLTYFIYANHPEGANYRYILRVGLKSLLIGLTFLWSAHRVFTSEEFHQGLSKAFLSIAFLIYALQMFWHVYVVFGNAFGLEILFPFSTYGVIDLFSLSVIGLSMVLWLLENEQRLLVKANRELDSFLYSTSHDLRAPIASILGLINIAEHDVKESIAHDYFGKIKERIQQLDNTIKDILMLSKSANAEPEIISVDLDKLLNKIILGMDFYSGAREITFHRLLQTREIKTDELQLENILMNLISNAVKYHDTSKNDPYIKVAVTQDKHSYYISVEDNGQGIPDSSVNQIFRMFYRANDSSDGTGLGLYIVNEAINRLGGKITVESTHGEGTTFFIKLPKPKV